MFKLCNYGVINMAIWCHQTNLTYNFKTSLEPSYQSSNDDISLLTYFRPYYISRIKTKKRGKMLLYPPSTNSKFHKLGKNIISKLIMASHFIFFSNSIKYYTFLHLTKLFTVTILIYNRYLIRFNIVAGYILSHLLKDNITDIPFHDAELYRNL